MMSSILASSLCFRTTLLILQCIKTFCSPESSAEKEEKHYGDNYDFHMCFVELAFKGVLCTHLGDKRPQTKYLLTNQNLQNDAIYSIIPL